jgi:hypothetical protein
MRGQPKPLTSRERLPHANASFPDEQLQTERRRKNMRLARSSKRRPELLAIIESRYLGGIQVTLRPVEEDRSATLCKGCLSIELDMPREMRSCVVQYRRQAMGEHALCTTRDRFCVRGLVHRPVHRLGEGRRDLPADPGAGRQPHSYVSRGRARMVQLWCHFESL